MGFQFLWSPVTAPVCAGVKRASLRREFKLEGESSHIVHDSYLWT